MDKNLLSLSHNLVLACWINCNCTIKHYWTRHFTVWTTYIVFDVVGSDRQTEKKNDPFCCNMFGA